MTTPRTAGSTLRSLSAWQGQAIAAVPFLLVPILFVIGATTISGYATKPSIISLLILSSLLGLASIGQTFAIIVGGVDFSIPAVIGLSNVMITQLYGEGWSFGSACLLILGLAVLIGVTNSLASLFLRVHPLITTLGVGLIISGGVLTWREGNISGSVPPWLMHSVSVIHDTGPIPLPGVVVAWIVASAGVIWFQRGTRLGREIYATGSNPLAARLARVRTTWAFVFAFVASAVFAAVVGVLFAGYTGTADANVGQPYLFQTITAVVVGGTSLLGGRGGYGRTIAGALIISQLTTLLVGAGYGPSTQEALLGLLIVVLVSIYGRESAVATRI